jgi:GTP1/Obg family GTP-binding protein
MRSLAIRKAHPEVVNILCDNDSVWTAWDENDKVVELDEELIKVELEKIQAEQKLVEYKKLRKAEYPSIEECVHAILDDNLEELQAKRKAVKDKYPKSELKDGN